MEQKIKPLEVICVACPKGCRLEVHREGGEILVSHEGCKRGREYAVGEITDPRRMVASTVRVTGAVHPLVPVYTAAPFPKGRIHDLLDLLRKVKLHAPVYIDQVIMRDVLGTGIDVIASRNLE